MNIHENVTRTGNVRKDSDTSCPLCGQRPVIREEWIDPDAINYISFVCPCCGHDWWFDEEHDE